VVVVACAHATDAASRMRSRVAQAHMVVLHREAGMCSSCTMWEMASHVQRQSEDIPCTQKRERRRTPGGISPSHCLTSNTYDRVTRAGRMFRDLNDRAAFRRVNEVNRANPRTERIPFALDWSNHVTTPDDHSGSAAKTTTSTVTSCSVQLMLNSIESQITSTNTCRVRQDQHTQSFIYA
jgi:hypothetical protein